MVLGNSSWVKRGDESPTLMKKGDVLPLQPDAPLLIESPGKVGVLVIPTSTSSSTINVTLRDVSSWAGEAAQTYAAHLISSVLTEVTEIQGLMSSGRAREALPKVKKLQEQYPRVAHLKYLEASCLTLMGDRKNARVVLEEAKILDQDVSSSAQDFNRALAGEGKEAP